MEKLQEVEINKKLMSIQSELKAPKNQFSKFGGYHYRSAEDILDALKPLLKKYECTVRINDEIKQVGEFTFIESKCTFSDGKVFLQTKAQAGIDVTKQKMDLSQKFGSASSYARKYALNGMFLIDDVKDADTDEHQKQVSNQTSEQSKPEKKWLNPGTKDWDNAISKNKPLEEVKKFYRISKTNEEKYKSELNK